MNPALQFTDIILTREYLMAKRQALLMELDALERLINISPRTAELRKEARAMGDKIVTKQTDNKSS